MKVSVPRLIAAYLTAIVPTLASYRILNTDEYLLLFLIYSICAVSLAVAHSLITIRWLQVVIRTVEICLHLATAILIAFSLNLTPASAYLAWFRLVQDDSASGVLSVLFTLKVCFFATVSGISVLRKNLVASIVIAVGFAALVLYAVFQNPRIAYLSIGAAVVAMLISGVKATGRPAYRRMVPLIQIAIVAAGIAYPLSRTSPNNYSLLVHLVPTDIIANLMTRMLPNFPFLYNVPGYGHQLGEKSIGERPALTARPVFRVTGTPGETVYLRTAIYEHFTGQGWVHSSGRFSEITNQGYFTLDPPHEYDRPLRIEVLIDFFSNVPHTLDTESINFFRGDFPPLAYSGFDTGFLFEVPVVSGTTFYLKRQSFGTSNNNQEALSERNLPRNLGMYLQLPKDIPEYVRRLALAMVADTPVATSENIKRYLISNFYYSLDASVGEYHDNPAWSFLMGEGGGYCVHFATAYALLARLANIPARYVSGFLVNIPNDAESVEVPGYAAHAWVEIWTQDTGWITREATPPMIPEYFDDPTYYDLYNPLGSSYTGRQLELIMRDRIPPRPERSRSAHIDIDFTPILLVLAGIVGLSALVWFFLVSSRAPGSRKRRLTLALRTTVRKSLRYGAKHPKHVGWSRWAGEVEKTMLRKPRDDDQETIDSPRALPEQAVSIAHGVYFGEATAQTEDIRTIRQLKRHIGRPQP